MELERVMQVLADLCPTDPVIVSEAGVRDNVAFLRMHPQANPARWAVVSSSGVTWSSVEADTTTLGVPGRLSSDRVHEDSPDDEVGEILSECTAIAEAYVKGSGTLRRSPRMGLPQLAVDLPDGSSRVLRKSAASALRDLLRPTHWFNSLAKK